MVKEKISEIKSTCINEGFADGERVCEALEYMTKCMDLGNFVPLAHILFPEDFE